MAVGGDGPAIRLAPRARFGSDLKPRVAAAVAMGSLALATAWIGGFVFAVFWWLASIVLFWEWQRLVGGARLAERVATAGLALALTALFALHLVHRLLAKPVLTLPGVIEERKNI